MHQKKILKYKAVIQKLVEQNGPDIADYPYLDSIMNELGSLKSQKIISENDILNLQNWFGESMRSNKTLQGHVCIKPHGYPGDFEIIDKIYTNYISEDFRFKNWDYYFHNQKATKAVRNRKIYFKKVLKSIDSKSEVLNLASGPGRDLFEFFTEFPESEVEFDCVEIDDKAIEYASELFKSGFLDFLKINFYHKNVFRFCSGKKYDLIWSAGLFDYFDDNTFVRLLSRFLKNLKEDGEIVIGNFHEKNPSRHYMEFGQWYLFHRSEEKMFSLAKKCGIQSDKIKICKESEGVNLFMHIKN